MKTHLKDCIIQVLLEVRVIVEKLVKDRII